MVQASLICELDVFMAGIGPGQSHPGEAHLIITHHAKVSRQQVITRFIFLEDMWIFY